MSAVAESRAALNLEIMIAAIMTNRRPPRKDNQHSAPVESTAATNPQAHILSGLNIVATLEEQAPLYLHAALHFGPKSFAGDGWAAVLVWYRPKGLHLYRTLTLFGIWASQESEATTLLIGTKQLNYSAAVFNPESYHQLIRRDFQTYYQDDGSPPATSDSFYRTPYDAAQRLTLRETIAKQLIEGLKHLQV